MMQSPLFMEFSLQQMLAVLALGPAIYAIVYMLFRSGDIFKGATPILYFIILTLGLLFDFSEPVYYDFKYEVFFIGTTVFLCLPIMTLLLSEQIVFIRKFPAWWHYALTIGMLILAFVPSYLMIFSPYGAKCMGDLDCRQDAVYGLIVVGVIVGALFLFGSVMTLRSFSDLWKDKLQGRERYWLVICLIFTNAAYLMMFLGYAARGMDKSQLLMIREILALLFVYLVSTSLFRIFPVAVFINKKPPFVASATSVKEQHLRKLIDVDKVYQEASYGRKNLAVELDLSEAQVSALVNTTYQMTLPQLFSERRVAEAKILLKQTRAPVESIAEESGFGSLTTFNRVFKEVTGQTPTSFRKTKETN